MSESTRSRPSLFALLIAVTTVLSGCDSAGGGSEGIGYDVSDQLTGDKAQVEGTFDIALTSF